MNDAVGNSIKAESTREILDQDDAGLAGCLINLDYDKGPKILKKREPVILDDSESEEYSQDLDSDEDDLPSEKRTTKIDRRPTKRVKSSAPVTGNTYNAPPQLPPSSGQNYISCQDRLVKAFDKKKTYFAKLSSRNTEYLCLRNKSIRDRVPRNINPALQADILEQSRSKADLPGDLRAALRDKCVELHLCFNLAPLDEKLCERLMQPAQSHEEAMIIDLKDISGYSFMGFVCRGMNYITANGQKVGKLISY